MLEAAHSALNESFARAASLQERRAAVAAWLRRVGDEATAAAAEAANTPRDVTARCGPAEEPAFQQEFDDHLTGGDFPNSRLIGLQLVDAEAWWPALFIWRELHRRFPHDSRFVSRILTITRKLGRPEMGIAVLEPGCLVASAWEETRGLFLGQLRVIGNDRGADAAADALYDAATRLACEARLGAIVIGEAPFNVAATLGERLRKGVIAVSPERRAAMADLLSRAGLSQAAAALFETVPDGAAQPGLGLRIAYQSGDRESLLARARGEREPADAAVQAVALSSARALDEIASAIAALPPAEGEQALAVLFDSPLRADAADMFARIAATGTAIARTAKLCLTMAAGEARTAGDVEPLLEAGLSSPRLRMLLVREFLTGPAPVEDKQTVLDRLDLADQATANFLRHATSGERHGYDPDVTIAMLMRLARAYPQEHWLSLKAMNVCLEHGRTARAHEIAADIDLSTMRGPALVNAARTYKLLGLDARAQDMFALGAAKLESQTPPPQLCLMLARGLALTGRSEAAFAWYERAAAPLAGRVDTARPAVIDPGYTDAAGHHTNYCRFAHALITDLTGEQPIVYINRNADARFLEGLDTARTFLFEPYGFAEYALDHEDVVNLNTLFHRDLLATFGSRRPPFVYVHSMRFTMLVGFLRWLSETERAAPSVVVVGLIEADFLAESDAVGLGEELRAASRAATGREDVALVVYAETDAAVRWLSSWMDPAITVEKYPYLAASRARPRARPHPPETPRAPTFGIAGATRADRGFAPLLKAVLATRDVEADWLVQIDPAALSAFRDGAADSYAEIRALGAGNVRFVEGFLTVDDYYDLLERIDCLVLPYTGRYAVSGSGVVFEAVHALRYVIVAQGTTLQSELAALGYPHAVIDPRDAASLADAVRRTARDWPSIEAALAAFEASREELPAERFQRRLAGLAERAAAPAAVR